MVEQPHVSDEVTPEADENQLNLELPDFLK
jgi:hypothetical protein